MRWMSLPSLPLQRARLRTAPLPLLFFRALELQPWRKKWRERVWRPVLSVLSHPVLRLRQRRRKHPPRQPLHRPPLQRQARLVAVVVAAATRVV